MVRSLLVALVVLSGAVAMAPMATADAPYKNCTQARQNGDTDITSSSDKYGSWLDRVVDGIGCES